MAFEILDGDGKIIYYTTSADMATEIDSPTVAAYHVRYDGTTNAKVNGTWRLSLRSSGDNYTTKPKLNITYKYPSGTEGLK